MSNDEMKRQEWDESGRPLAKHADCPFCGEDEIGSHFESAWCHACGWNGSIGLLKAERAKIPDTDQDGSRWLLAQAFQRSQADGESMLATLAHREECMLKNGHAGCEQCVVHETASAAVAAAIAASTIEGHDGVVVVHQEICAMAGSDESTCTCAPTTLQLGAQA